MKNATAYEKKIKSLLSGMSRKISPRKITDPFAFLIEAILQAEVPRKQAAAALNAIAKEFVDFNELRVAPVKDIADCLGRELLGSREKSESLIKTLNGIFDHSNSMSMEYLEKMPKRDLRKHLHELGACPFAAALITMTLFGGHAVPVDFSLLYCLENDECIPPGSTVEEVQGFLERVISQKDGLAAHEFLRDYIEKNAKFLAKKRKDLAAAIAVEAAKAAEKAAEKAAKAARAAKAPVPVEKLMEGEEAIALPHDDDDEVAIDVEVEDLEILDEEHPAPKPPPAKPTKPAPAKHSGKSKSTKHRKK